MTRIDALFDIERTINGETAERRLAVRREQCAPLVAELGYRTMTAVRRGPRFCVMDPEAGQLTARFEGRDLLYGFGELDALVPAYAATVHKSEGSEYPVVVIPVLTQHYVMLKRNLLYTGVTRGKRLVVLVGQKNAVAIAVRNASGRRRWSKLDEWLAGAKAGKEVETAGDGRSLRERPLTGAMSCG